MLLLDDGCAIGGLVFLDHGLLADPVTIIVAVALTNRGWHRDMLKTGESVTVDGWQAKDGSHLANARSLKMPNGKTMSAASSYTGAGKKTPSAGN